MSVRGRVTTLLLALSLLLSAVASAAEISLTYWGQFSDTAEQEQAIIDAFNKQYTGRIRVEMGPHMSTEEMREKLMVAYAGGAAPEVVKFDRFAVSEWAHKGIFKPIDNLIARDGIRASDYYPAAWNELNFEGRMYGLPWDMDVRGYIYNKTVFAEAGIAQPPATWEEAENLAKRLDRCIDGIWSRAGFVAREGNWFFYGWLLTAGGNLLDSTNRKIAWDSSEGRKAAAFLQENTLRYGNDAIKALKKGGLYGALGDGRIASTVGGSWFIGSILKAVPDAEIGVSPAPRPAELAKQPTSWSGGFSLVITSSTPTAKEEAAWEFVKHMGSKDALVMAFQGSGQGRLPTIRAAAMDQRFRESKPAQLDSFMALLPFAQFRPVIPGGEALWKIYRNELETAILDQFLPVENVLADTARRGQITLDEAWAGTLK